MLKIDLPNRFARKNFDNTIQVAQRKLTYQRTYIEVNKNK